MAASDPVYDSILALKGGDLWRSTLEIADGLRAHGADFIETKDISKWLDTGANKLVDEHYNPSGIYKKRKGYTLLTQIRRRGEQPDLSFFPPRDKTIAREWEIRGALDADLVTRLRAHPPIAARLAAAAATPAHATGASSAAASVAPREMRARGPTMLPAWVDESCATHGAWTFTRAPDGCSATYALRSEGAAHPSIVVDVVARDAADPLVTVRVLYRAHAHDTVAGSDALRLLLRALGSKRICVGVGAADSKDARWVRGFDALATAAVREGAATLLERAAGDPVVGIRAGGELLNHVDRLVGGAPAGPRFRSTQCALVESSKWTARRGGAHNHCDNCALYLRSLISCVSANASTSDEASGAAPSKYTRHDFLARDPASAAAALAAAATRLHAAQADAARARACRDRAIKRMATESHRTPSTCEGTAELTRSFVELQKSEEFNAAFPAGTVRRYIWDDQMRNNQRVADGASRAAFRYHPVTLKFALRLLIKNGASGYEEIREVFPLPCVRYLTNFKNAFKDVQGVQHDVLEAMRTRARNEKMSAWAKHGIIKWDAMKCSEGVIANVRTGELVGFEFEDIASLDHLQHELRALDGEESTPKAAAKPKVAKYWTEVFFSSVGIGSFSYSVYRMATSDLCAHHIVNMVHDVLTALDMHDFIGIGCVCDGASEHRKMQKECGTISVGDVVAALRIGVLDYELMMEHSGAVEDLSTCGELKIAFAHPVSGMPVFLMSDPPHLIKKLLSSLYKSSKKGDAAQSHTTRAMTKYIPHPSGVGEIECPLSLRQARDVWRARNGSRQYALTANKLTEEHFAPTASSRMRVLSATMAGLIREDIAKDPTHAYNFALAEYCDKSNEYVDIMNGKHGAIFGPFDSKLEKLTSFARWFEEWDMDLSKRDLTKGQQDEAFISRLCYFDLRLAVHGFVGMCRYYLAHGAAGFGKCINPKQCNQDLLEHHFRNVRNASGDALHPKVAECARAARTGTVIRLSCDKKSNSGSAPVVDADQPLLLKSSVKKRAAPATGKENDPN